jgi:PhnB protein
MANPATAVTPYLCVKDATRAIEFYKQVLGATELTRWTDDKGRIGHAEIAIGGSPIFLADEHPEIGVLSPRTSLKEGARSPVLIHVYVPDVDETYRRALAAGAESLRNPTDEPYGDRSAQIRDASGHIWFIATHKEDLTGEELRKRGQGYKIESRS